MVIDWISKKEAAMKSNFEFLKEYWPALAQIGETAENYLHSMPYNLVTLDK